MADQTATAKDEARKERKPPVVVSIINLKGGVGKTTFSAITARRAADEYRCISTLAVDLDPQANLSQALMGENAYNKFMDDGEPSIVELFNGYLPPSAGRSAPGNLGTVAKEVKGWKYRPETLHLIPSRFDFSDRLVNSIRDTDERVLARFIAKEMAHKELILIDCAPTESVLTRTAYHASRYILIPVRLEFFSVIGFPLLEQSLEKFKMENPAHKIEVCGILINQTKTKSVRPSKENRDALVEIEKMAGKYGWKIMDERMVFSDAYPRLMRGGHPKHSGDSEVNARKVADAFLEMVGLL